MTVLNVPEKMSRCPHCKLKENGEDNFSAVLSTYAERSSTKLKRHKRFGGIKENCCPLCSGKPSEGG